MRRQPKTDHDRDLPFQSTHPLRGATPYPFISTSQSMISIHAPLAGCDPVKRAIVFLARDFNPRTPCGVRQDFSERFDEAKIFQSTHPLRGATIYACSKSAAECISIHAPLAGCDAQSGDIRRTLPHFNPRTPCGVRPDGADLYGMRYNFNPRTPCGVRPNASCSVNFCSTFQSTHPLRGATYSAINDAMVKVISIHAPLAGCDYIAEDTNRQYR